MRHSIALTLDNNMIKKLLAAGYEISDYPEQYTCFLYHMKPLEKVLIKDVETLKNYKEIRGRKIKEVTMNYKCGNGLKSIPYLSFRFEEPFEEKRLIIYGSDVRRTELNARVIVGKFNKNKDEMGVKPWIYETNTGWSNNKLKKVLRILSGGVIIYMEYLDTQNCLKMIISNDLELHEINFFEYFNIKNFEDRILKSRKIEMYEIEDGCMLL